MWNFLLLLAEGEAPKGTEPAWAPLLPFIPLLILLYLFMIRPMRKQEAERKALLGMLEKNDRVLTSSGIYGTVVAVSDKEDEVTVKVDDNVRLRMIKSSIVRNLTKEEAAKAPKQGAA